MTQWEILMKYFLCLMLASCTMFDKRGSDELGELTADALKAHRDIEVEIKAVPEAK